MKNIEIFAFIPRIPECLMGPIRNGDYKLTEHRGEEYVSEGLMEEEILNLLIGSACLTKAKEISQDIKHLSRKGEVPEELNLAKEDLSQWGASIILESLHRLGTS